MNAEARAAIEWTRGQLSAPQRHFLADLPPASDPGIPINRDTGRPWRGGVNLDMDTRRRLHILSRLGRWLSLPVPQVEVIEIFDWLIEHTVELRMETAGFSVKCSSGRHLTLPR